MARPGNVAFLSQSVSLTAILDWSLREQVGFSAFISLGAMLDVGWGDLIDYLGDDPRTHSIVLYMESIGDARAFLSAAREVALTKPIIVIKAGRPARRPVARPLHIPEPSLDRDDVLDAAFRRSGVLRVNEIGDVSSTSRKPRLSNRDPLGPRLAMVTNAGGPAVLATDALVAAGGGAARAASTGATFDPTQRSHCRRLWSHGNPIDVLGDADPARYAKALERRAEDRSSDGLLVILTPQDMTDPTLYRRRPFQVAHYIERQADSGQLDGWGAV